MRIYFPKSQPALGMRTILMNFFSWKSFMPKSSKFSTLQQTQDHPHFIGPSDIEFGSLKQDLEFESYWWRLVINKIGEYFVPII